MSSFSIKLDLSSLDSAVDAQADKVQAAIRPAAQAGAQVMYDEVKSNVARIGIKTGNLASSIYQAYSKENSSPSVATYHVSWNARKAPHGHLVEYGHVQKYRTVLNKKGQWITLKKHPLPAPKHVAARPFMRPAMAKEAQAYSTMVDELERRLSAA